MSFRIHWRDTELRFVAKFGENRPLPSCWKVLWITTQINSGSAGLVPAPILPKMGRSRPKFPERCHPVTCPRVPNLVRIGCALPDLFWKDWFFCPKSIRRRIVKHNGRGLDSVLTEQDVLHAAVVDDTVRYDGVTDVKHLLTAIRRPDGRSTTTETTYGRNSQSRANLQSHPHTIPPGPPWSRFATNDAEAN